MAAIGPKQGRAIPAPIEAETGRLERGPLTSSGHEMVVAASGETFWLRERPAQPGAGLAEEASRLAWLADVGVTAPVTVANHRDDEGREWLLTRSLAGSPASAGEHQFDPQALVANVAQLLRQLHGRSTEECPFISTVDELVAVATARVEGGFVSSGQFDEAYRSYEPAELLDRVLSTRPDAEDHLVVAHGAPRLEHLWLSDGGAGGVVGVANLGVADRHLDLALVARSLVAHLGPEALAAFLEAYDRADPDDPAAPSLLRLDFFVGLSQFVVESPAGGA